MNRFLRRLVCWWSGHGDLRIRKVNPVHRVTVYECRECGDIWAERDGVAA
jgi:predicted SprT family Zn-dependent metalloprotease